MDDFKKKLKEPILSDFMKDLIDRTHKKNKTDRYDGIDIYKSIIMKELLNDQDILNTLHNENLAKNIKKKLDDSGNPVLVDGEEIYEIDGTGYQDVAIFNFLKVPDIQSEVKNFICFEVNDIEIPRLSTVLMTKNIIFRTISHESDYKTDYGIARQDLLAAIIKSKFDWSNMFGMHLELCSDRGRVAENGYYYREFVYETTTANNLVNKSLNGGVGYGR